MWISFMLASVPFSTFLACRLACRLADKGFSLAFLPRLTPSNLYLTSDSVHMNVEEKEAVKNRIGIGANWGLEKLECKTNQNPV
ncbi:uncharacterized protein Bfra_008165 [Botrytis fragariae]|uniref:Uncharacterized protein n=1 Tax=Botrytis fragariae TaxID=1964551 RepID=A0A8H6ASB7_9HELO|nr:uncharacterized protein Bfra_008165 [Botrytis fragariae]KAF5872888.1 hypothetical protein Bfra_008165 [Botrytis fragariae]